MDWIGTWFVEENGTAAIEYLTENDERPERCEESEDMRHGLIERTRQVCSTDCDS